jgi:LPS-assembly lipoprotein
MAATRAIVAAVLAALAASCGFHLQGREPLPAVLATVYVDTDDPQTDFAVHLRKSLLASGARLVDDPGAASAVVRILDDAATRSVVSVSAENAPVASQIQYSVRFAVRAGERELLSPQTLSASQQFSFDERLLLAKENEENILREALARDLAGVAMRRLSSL